MSTQQALALSWPAPSNTVVINARCNLRIEADQHVIVVAGLPVHHYRAEDAVAEAYAMVFLVESGFAQQTDVARAFARSVRTVRRYQGRYAQDGMTALGREEGWRRGRRRISGKRLRTIEMLKSQGMSNRAIAHRLGVSEKAIRKLVGASKPAESAQLTFASRLRRRGSLWRRRAGHLRSRLAMLPIAPRHRRRAASVTAIRSSRLRTTTSRCR
jgi:transposase